ncbi:MAG: SDR family oxidoreductase [Bacteroidota bacterium]
MESIRDKVIIITGASSGIGAATARRLVQSGAKVVLAARREDRLREIADQAGSDCIYITTDVTSRSQIDKLVGENIAVFGQVDVFWNNAGIMPLSFFDEGKVDEWSTMIEVNIKGVLDGINAVLPHMLTRGQGHILATSSMGGINTFSGGGVYSATKFAVRAIMETLRKEVGEKIKVTTIYPGTVATELGHDITSAKVAALYGSLENLPRMNAEAVANAVEYALSQPGNISVNDILLMPLGKTVN